MSEKYLVVTPGYPNYDNIYNNGFVHSRVKQYISKDMNVVVFSINKCTEIGQYVFDDVLVNTGNHKCLEEFLRKNNFSKVLIHFGWKNTIDTILNVNKDIPLIIWVHGTEALGWYRRLFFFDIKRPHRFIGYILLNTRQMLFMHKLIKNKKINKKFVFVSEWMKNILEKDSFSKNKIESYEIIPNVVDESIFNYVEKKDSDRLNILSVRPYASLKYANDLSVKTVLELSKKPYFSKLKFTFYGDGRLFDKTLEPLRKFNNVSINKKFISQREIAKLHKKNGVMLIPTRQDAQGVSMCEAMSSGLVPIASNNTAIPEYLSINSGYLCDNVDEMVNAIDELYNNPQIFLEKSKNASIEINLLCNSGVVIEKEINYIKS